MEGKNNNREDGDTKVLRHTPRQNAGWINSIFRFPAHPMDLLSSSDDVVGGGGEGCARRDVHARGDGAHRRRRGRSRRGWCAAGTAES